MDPSFGMLSELLTGSIDIFRKEEALVPVEGKRIMIIGDIHGNKTALDFLLKVKEELDCDRTVFLGDYVDRGPDSVGVLCRLLELKIKAPTNIILLRGNHESLDMNIRYGFYREIGQDNVLMSLAQTVFSELPTAALVNGDVFCVHGGIPGAVSLADISKDNSLQFMWNDPSPMPGITRSYRGLEPKLFGNDVFSDFMRMNRLSLMIRGHSAVMEGYEWWFNKRLLSLFSTPGYCGNANKGAFALIEEKMLTVYSFGPDRSGSYSLESPAVKDGLWLHT